MEIHFCSQCNLEMRGFDYGFGVNPICGECHRKNVKNQDLEREKLLLEIEILKVKIKKQQSKR